MIEIKCSKDCVFIDALKIKVPPGRARKDFSLVPQLAESITVNGLINPIAVEATPDGNFSLCSGETRLRAMLLLGAIRIPCVRFDEMTPVQRKMHEIEENVRRQDMSWQERAEAIASLDETKKEVFGESKHEAKGKGWNQEKTAELLNVSVGTVSSQISLAKTFRERPDLKTATKDLPMTSAIRVIQRRLEDEKLQRLHEKGLIKTSTNLFLGKAQDYLRTLKNESVHLIVTDPPFGIPVLDDLEGDSRGESQTYTSLLAPEDNSTIEDLSRLFCELSPELFRVLAPGSHIYCFFAFESLRLIQDALSSSGFVFSSVPLIWDKMRTTTPFRGYEYSACYEPILFGFKPPRTRRLSTASSSILKFKPVESKEKGHPFEKPIELLSFLIEESSQRGEVVLDPFAGSGSTLLAASKTGRTGLGSELNKDHWNRAQVKLS
jgi:site-specific DNA-methyltransferase (adenine-specific)